MSDNTQKTSGFGIGELGRVPELSPEEQALENTRRENARRHARHSDCHYCGCQATHFNFFDVPVCDDCDH